MGGSLPRLTLALVMGMALLIGIVALGRGISPWGALVRAASALAILGTLGLLLNSFLLGGRRGPKGAHIDLVLAEETGEGLD